MNRNISSIEMKKTSQNKTMKWLCCSGDSSKKKKSWGFPWWSIYIGYFLAFCFCGVAFWCTVEVAGVFGLAKAKRWLSSFCISIVESIFLSQPIKVIQFFSVWIGNQVRLEFYSIDIAEGATTANQKLVLF